VKAFEIEATCNGGGAAHTHRIAGPSTTWVPSPEATRTAMGSRMASCDMPLVASLQSMSRVPLPQSLPESTIRVWLWDNIPIRMG